MSKEVSVQELLTSVIPNLSDIECTAIFHAVERRKAQIARQNVRTFRKGDLVKFDVRTGDVRGTVVKVNRKNIIVESALGGVMYRVPANMVTAL